MIGIYKITDKTNNKIYIGQSVNITRRFSEHRSNNFAKPGTIDYYINLKGIDNFIFEIIEECSVKELNQREMFWINYYNSYYSGYNLTFGGEGSSLGETNINACLTEEDVVNIRIAYNEHKQRNQIYNLYKNKISKQGFIAIWTGINWPHVMPEVFTEENKKYHISSAGHTKAIFSDEEILAIREKYITKTLDELYEEYKSKCSKRCLRGILNGENYKYLPLYRKRERKWVDGGKY